MGHRASSVTTSDGRIWATEGRVSEPAGRRYAPLVVNQTTARSMPSQQTQERGQMIPNEKDTLYETELAQAYPTARLTDALAISTLPAGSLGDVV